MIIAGFDLATTTGFAVLDGTRVINVGAYHAKGETDAVVFSNFRAWIRGLIRDHDIKRVAIEAALVTNIRKPKEDGEPGETFNPVTYRTYLRLYGLRAIAIQAAYGLGLPAPLEAHQASWRRSFTGNARASKEETLALAQRLVPGLKSKDAAEAIGVAWHLNGVLRIEQQIPKQERRHEGGRIGDVQRHFVFHGEARDSEG